MRVIEAQKRDLPILRIAIMKFAARTDKGKHRALNEDLYFVDERSNLFVVADGVGGHNAGDVASRIAVAVFEEWVQEYGKSSNGSSGTNPTRRLEILKQLAEEANHRVYSHSLDDKSSNAGMGTTLIAGFITQFQLIYVHVGDSRLYILRDGNISQITTDHSLVQKMVESGQLTSKEARIHPKRNIINRAIGFEPSVCVDYQVCPLRSKDIVFACTDGLHDMIVDDADIAELITNASDIDTASRKLIEKSLYYGGKDNVTLVLTALS